MVFIFNDLYWAAGAYLEGVGGRGWGREGGWLVAGGGTRCQLFMCHFSCHRSLLEPEFIVQPLAAWTHLSLFVVTFRNLSVTLGNFITLVTAFVYWRKRGRGANARDGREIINVTHATEGNRVFLLVQLARRCQ